MKRMSTFLVLLVLLLAYTTSSWAANTLTVGPGKQYSSIQTAVNAASGGDIVEVFAGTYAENVTIDPGKNGLSIIAHTADIPSVILDGTTVGSQKVGFRVYSDFITIKDFTIQNYNFTTNTDVYTNSTARGAGIESMIATYQHVFTGNIITNCNWGILVIEGNNVTVQDNEINDIIKSGYTTTPFELKRGGIGIAFVSSSKAMENNKINSNNVVNADLGGIWYGRLGLGNVGADFTIIQNNNVQNCDNFADVFGYSLIKIATASAVDFSGNTSDNNWAGLDIESYAPDDNEDISIMNNTFYQTENNSSIEVRSSDAYTGDRMYDIMANIGNEFMEVIDANDWNYGAGATAALEFNDDVVTSDGNFRYIRNNVNSSIGDAQTYEASHGSVRVYVGAGNYEDTYANITLTNSDDIIKIFSPLPYDYEVTGIGANLINDYMDNDPIIEVYSGALQAYNLAFSQDCFDDNQYSIVIHDANGSNPWIHDNIFATWYEDYGWDGVVINQGVTNAKIENNQFYGDINSAIIFDTDNNAGAFTSYATCNYFEQWYSNGIGIEISNQAGSADIMNINIAGNTFVNGFDYDIYVQAPSANALSGIVIGDKHNINFFEGGPDAESAIYIEQSANDQVKINYNDFVTAYYNHFLLINDNSYGNYNVSAGFNHWGVGPLGGTYTTTIPAKIITYIVGLNGIVDWLPIYTAGVTNTRTCADSLDNATLWAPVYTASETLGQDETTIIENGQDFYLNIQDAINAEATGPHSDALNNFVILFGDEFVENVTVPVSHLGVNKNNLWIGAAVSQLANGNPLVRPVPVVDGFAVAGATFLVQADGTTLDGMQILYQDDGASSDFPVLFAANVDYNTVGNCIIDVKDASNPIAAIMFADGNMDGAYLYQNTITFGNFSTGVSFYNVNDYMTATPTTSNIQQYVYIESNTFNMSGSTDIPSVILGSVYYADIYYNKFQNGIHVGIGDNDVNDIWLVDNEFNYLDLWANAFKLNLLVASGTSVTDHIYISQNYLKNIMVPFDFASPVTAPNQLSANDVTNFNDYEVSENWFDYSGCNDGINANVVGGPTANKINAINNYWNSAYGPDARQDAPAWHDEAGSTISSNSYYFNERGAEGTSVQLNNTTNIQFVPFWNAAPTGAGLIDTEFPYNFDDYASTSFSPITNNDFTPPLVESYASLIFAIAGTDDGGEIYMNNGNYDEQNTIYQNNAGTYIDKSLSIYGQLDFPLPVRLTAHNLLTPVMFNISSSAGETIYFNLIDFYQEDAFISSDDFLYTFNFGQNITGTIDFCNITGFRNNNGDQYGVYVSDPSAIVNISNGTISGQSATGFADAFGIIKGRLNADYMTLLGNSSFTGIAQSGVYQEDNSTLNLTNSTIQDYIAGTGSCGYYAEAYNPIITGTTNIRENVFTLNNIGLQFGNGNVDDDWSDVVTINDNAIVGNTHGGLVYNSGYVAIAPLFTPSTLNAQNNYWGKVVNGVNGPISKNTFGGTTYHTSNTFNETQQNPDYVENLSPSSKIDYIPWRMWDGGADQTLSKTSGHKFAPIVVTNNGNITKELFSNFNDAVTYVRNTGAAGEYYKIFAFFGTYSEHFNAVVNEIGVKIIGKRNTPTAVDNIASWITSPNSIYFENAWTPSTSSQGCYADGTAPKFIYDGGEYYEFIYGGTQYPGAAAEVNYATDPWMILTGGGSALADGLPNITISGFEFDMSAKVASATVPYSGNPMRAITTNETGPFGISNSNIISYNNFTGVDAADIAIDLGYAGQDDWTISHNKITGPSTGDGIFVNMNSQNHITNMNVTLNYIDKAGISILVGAGTFDYNDITYNEFRNTTGAIRLDKAAFSSGTVSALYITNNIFENGTLDGYAFGILAGVGEDMMIGGPGHTWTDEINFTGNWVGKIIPSVPYPVAVGFFASDAVTKYSSSINASCNWWYDESKIQPANIIKIGRTGPTYVYNPSGLADVVSDKVAFTPWLTGSTNTAAFGFHGTDDCNGGERVWANSNNVATNKTMTFPSLQMCLNEPSVNDGTLNHIFVNDDYTTGTPADDAPTGDGGFLNESINFDLGMVNTLGSYTISAETPTKELNLKGTVTLDGIIAYEIIPTSPLRIQGGLVLNLLGVNGWIALDDKDLTVEGFITEGTEETAVWTRGTAFLVKDKVDYSVANNFPIYVEGAPHAVGTDDPSQNFVPARITTSVSSFVASQGNVLKMRAKIADPVADKGMGEDNNDVNVLWTIDFTNNNGTTNPQFDLFVKYPDTRTDVLVSNMYGVREPGFVQDVNSYLAFWNILPTPSVQWTSAKQYSSQNGTAGIICTGVNLQTGRSDWSVFSGKTSFALSDVPNQAKNIQWISGDDNTLKFRWSRNGNNTTAQYFAILGVEGTITTLPETWPSSWVLASEVCGVGVQYPFTCNSGAHNFADGYIKKDADITTGSGWSPIWKNAKFHNGTSTPSNVKVLAVGKYSEQSNPTTPDITIDNLSQGTNYMFFVSNFNYGHGDAAVADLITCTENSNGMANYNINSSTLNPRVRKTQPALYMTIDLIETYAVANANANHPSLVWGKIFPTDMFTAGTHPNHHYWRNSNGLLSGDTVITNLNNDYGLTGGYYANICSPNTASSANVRLWFKGYGNNFGANWKVRYSENNTTLNFSALDVDFYQDRLRNSTTNYKLVNAYDGDGKVAYLHDNNSDIRYTIDNTTNVTYSASVAMPRCAGTGIDFTKNITSTPAPVFVEWVNGDGTPLSLASTVTSTTEALLKITSLSAADNGRVIKAKFTAMSVCDYPNFSTPYYSANITLGVYDPTLTGSTPTTGSSYCSTDASAIITAARGTMPANQDLKLQGWKVSSDAGSTWSTMITTSGTYNGAALTVSAVGGTSGTITVTNLSAITSNHRFLAVWKNGDCGANTETAAIGLTITTKPVVSVQPTTPAAVCVGTAINVSATATPYTAVVWQISSDNVTFTNLTDGSVANGTVAGASTQALTLTPSTNGWNNYWVRAKYTTSLGGCETNTNSVKLTVNLSPVITSITPNTTGGICEGSNLVLTASGTSNITGNIIWQYYDGTVWQSALPNGMQVINNPYLSSNIGFSGTANSVLTINAINYAWNGKTVRAYNTNGSCAASAEFTINVVQVPAVSIGSFTNATICTNQSTTITASCSTPYTAVQWHWDGGALGAWATGTTGLTLTITNPPATLNGTHFYATFSNTVSGYTCTGTTSNSAALAVLEVPVLDAASVPDQTVCEGTTLSATATGNFLVGNKQWFWGNTAGTATNAITSGNPYNGSTVNLSGVTLQGISIVSTNIAWDGKWIRVKSDNGFCSDEKVFQVTINKLPVIATNTSNQTGCAGSTVIFAFTDNLAGGGIVNWQIYNGSSWSPLLLGSGNYGTTGVAKSVDSRTITLTTIDLVISGYKLKATITNGVCSTPVSTNESSITVTQAPAAPATVSSSNVKSTRFDISWSSVGTATKYYVEYSTNSLFTSGVTTVDAGAATSYTGIAACALTKNTTYYFRVRSWNSCGYSSYTTNNVTTLNPTVSDISWKSGSTGVFGDVVNGTQSTAQTYTITYSQLDADVQVVVPTGYVIYDGTSWLTAGTRSLGLTLDGGSHTKDIQVKYAPVTCGTTNVDFAHSTTNVTCANTTFTKTDIIAGSTNDASGTGIVATPTLAANALIVTESPSNTFNASWTYSGSGYGAKKLVVVSKSDALAWTPAPNTDYTTFFGSAPNGTVESANGQITAGQTWVTNVTSSSSATITGLTANTNYYVYVFEFNDCGSGSEKYYNTPKMDQPYYLAFASNDPASPATVIPGQVSGVPFKTSNSNALEIYVSFHDRANANPIVKSTPTTIDITPNYTEFTLSGGPVVILQNESGSNTFSGTWTNGCGRADAQLSASATNISGTSTTNEFRIDVVAPTQQARIILWVGVPCADDTDFKWTNGQNSATSNRLVVASEDPDQPELPTDGNYYSYSRTYGAGDLIGDHTYVVDRISGSTNYTYDVKGLTSGKTYWFRVFEYNGCSAGFTKYNLGNATFNPRSRTISCKAGNDLNDLIVDNFDVNSNKGTGIVTFRTLYEQNISGFEVRRIELNDNSNMAPELVGTYMNNKDLVALGNSMTGKSYNYADNSITLEVGKTYLYQLTAIAFDGSRIDVAEAEITISDNIVSGVSEFSVSPVTVIDNNAKFMVTVGNIQNVTINMYDLQGNKIAEIANSTTLNSGTTEYNVAVNKFTNGTYVIVAEFGNSTAVQKFQIAR